jgi:hypothetical protein
VQITGPGMPGVDAFYDPMSGVLSWTVLPSSDDGGADYYGYAIEISFGDGFTPAGQVHVGGPIWTGAATYLGHANPVIRVQTINSALARSPWSLNYVVPMPMVEINLDGSDAEMQEQCDDTPNPAQCMMTAMMAMGMHEHDGTMMEGCEMEEGSDHMMMCSINASMSMTASMMGDDMSEVMNITIPSPSMPWMLPDDTTAGTHGGGAPIPALPMGMLPDVDIPIP